MLGHLLLDVLRNAILITGLVVVMMMLIESCNIESKGLVFKGLRRSKIGQVIFSALLGAVPGCMGGFAVVSLYTHRLVSFGALIAMMIATTGDESFVMMAMMPDTAMQIFILLFALAVGVGIVTDLVYERVRKKKGADLAASAGAGASAETEADAEMVRAEHDCCGHDGHDAGHGLDHGCEHGYAVHEGHDKKRSFSWIRVLMFIGVAVFIAALVSGSLDHEHGGEGHEHAAAVHEGGEAIHDAHMHDGGEAIHDAGDAGHRTFRINLLDEAWMQYLFAALSLIVLGCLIFASDHFVKEHLWEHIVKRHLPGIFAWTLGVLLFVSIGLQYVDITGWISDNPVLMILLAAAIGIIPESGPHMVFVTLFAGGVIPLPVLLANSISQDGHAALPLLAESKKSFAWAKLLNLVIAVAVGLIALIFC